jgi:hypothetical protein
MEKKNEYRTLVGKPEGKSPLGRPRCRWVDNMKMDLKRDRVRWYELGWINLAQDRALVNTVINLRVP